jgi:vacuole morphology and inheritance protein 14
VSLNFCARSVTTTLNSRSKIGREDIKWQELLLHFRSIQAKHEKARRQALGTETTPFSGFSATNSDKLGEALKSPVPSSRPPLRRKVTGPTSDQVLTVNNIPNAVQHRPGVLSPLNPRARGSTGMLASALSGGGQPVSPTSGAGQQAGKQKRTLSLSRK